MHESSPAFEWYRTTVKQCKVRQENHLDQKVNTIFRSESKHHLGYLYLASPTDTVGAKF